MLGYRIRLPAAAWLAAAAAAGGLALVAGRGQAAPAVQGSFPKINSVNPSSGQQGQDLQVRLFGSGFRSGVTVGFGAGITVNSAVVSSTGRRAPQSEHIITCQISIAPDAPTGPHDVTVVNPDQGTDTADGAFTVNPAGGGGRLQITPRRLNFPQTPLGSVRMRNLRIKNTGRGTLTGTIIPPEAPFSVTPLDPFSIEPGQSILLEVQFAPTEAGRFRGEIGFTSSDPRRMEATVRLQGRGRMPRP